MHTVGNCIFSRSLVRLHEVDAKKMMVQSVRIVMRTMPRKKYRRSGRRKEQRQELWCANHVVDHVVFKPLEDLLDQIDDFHDNSKPQTGENDCGGDLRCICDTLHSDTHVRPIERRHTAQTITSRASEPLTILQQAGT